MQYCFPWRKFRVPKFWSVCFSNSKFLLTFRSSRRCSVRIGVLGIFTIHRKTLVPESFFLINLQAWGTFLIKLQLCNFIKKETLAQVFSCEFWEISKNTLFYRIPGDCFCRFYDIWDFLKYIFHEFKITRFILFVFINKIVMFT